MWVGLSSSRSACQSRATPRCLTGPLPTFNSTPQDVAHTANAQRAKRHRAVAGRVFKQTRPGFVWVGGFWVGGKARHVIDKKNSTVNCHFSTAIFQIFG